jgi:hypothetical protein
METFFPETRRPLPPRPVTSDLVELMRIRKAEIAAERAREEWAKLTARAREFSKEKEKRDEEVIVEREEESADNAVGEEVVQQDDSDDKEHVEGEDKREVVVEEEGTGEVEKRFYSQLELSEREASKRGLLNWVMQMEYAGKTFFDGYVFPLLHFPLHLAFRDSCRGRRRRYREWDVAPRRDSPCRTEVKLMIVGISLQSLILVTDVSPPLSLDAVRI